LTGFHKFIILVQIERWGSSTDAAAAGLSRRRMSVAPELRELDLAAAGNVLVPCR